MCLKNPHKQYTVQLKTDVYIAADAVGDIGRFANRSCEANCRIEELKGENGPEIAIDATRVINPGECITANYGPDQNFYCTCGSSQCIDRDRRDPLVQDKVTSRLRSGK
eukprot:jgi/Phyca11/119305/e_gw1.38.410.1